MSKLTEKAKEYTAKGLSVLPTDKDKKPVTAWKKYQAEIMSLDEIDTYFSRSSVAGIGIITGAVSGSLEVIDVDSKYDLTRSPENEIGDLWRDLSSTLEESLPNVFKSLVIAKTKGGGYHIYYRCSSIGGNVKLAERYTTPQERAEPADKLRVLIETRGEGGYVIAPPTPGYEYIQGNLNEIATITPQDRDTILNISRSFNEVEKEDPKPVVNKPTTTTPTPGLSPWEDYNNRGDVVSLLVSKGWKVVNQIGDRINFLRPGKTDSKTSGNYHTGLRVFKVWSSSTEFSTDRGYNPSQVFSLLECNGDSKETYKKLLELGYGEAYRSDSYQPKKVIELKSIGIETKDTTTGKTATISSPGSSLKVEDVTGSEVVITSPGSEAKEEILRAIDSLLEAGKRIYIKEAGVEVREYTYYLQAIYQKYGTISTEKGGLTDRDTDSLQDEIVILSGKLQPIDRDLFRSLFLSQPATQELGITEESLSLTVDKLTTTRDKENQAKDFKKLLSEATTLQDKGEIDKALELIESKVKEVKNQGAKNLLPPPLTFSNLLEEIANIPPAYKTGYSSLDDFIGFTPGGVTLIGGRPGHGKTTFMFNLLLQMAELYPDESFYFFSYEEAVGNISIKLLNRLIDADLSEHFREVNISKPSNYEFIKHYIRNRRTDIPEIESGKRELQELMDSKRITVIGKNYSVEDLSGLIPYLVKREKVGAIFIDYIQRMNTERKTQDKRTEVAYISDQVLQIAKGTGLPLILGAQLNRDVKGKPTLENLKEAGNLEEDANTVISVYCEAREKEETEEGEDYSKMREVDLVIKVLKNREGEVNTKAVLTFDRYTTVIKDKEAGSYVVKKKHLQEVKEKPKSKKQIIEDKATPIIADIRRIIQENVITELKPITQSKILNYCRSKQYPPEVITAVVRGLKPDIDIAKIDAKTDKANE